nr:putative transcriptional regulatory protein c15d4.02 [Quercus suber]
MSDSLGSRVAGAAMQGSPPAHPPLAPASTEYPQQFTIHMLPPIQPSQPTTQSRHELPPAGPPYDAPSGSAPGPSYVYSDAFAMHHHPPRPLPPAMPVGPGQAMRYAIPHAPLSMQHMSAGRHKKEIKKRTKSGCLTCRKRRIKVSVAALEMSRDVETKPCDELKPFCQNCHKSKRACLGYDNAFKDPPGQAHIQPAPSVIASSSRNNNNTTNTTPQSHHLATPTYPPHVYPLTPPEQSYSRPASTSTDSHLHYGQGVSLDPALNRSDPLGMAQSKPAALQASRPGEQRSRH